MNIEKVGQIKFLEKLAEKATVKFGQLNCLKNLAK
jgi:hypothetical protein